MTKKSLLKIDVWLLLPVAILLLISLTTLLSIDVAFFRNQLFALVVAIIAFLFVSQFNYQVFRIFSIPFYILALIALTIVFIIGFESRGAVRWIELFGVSIQFSEIFKPLLAITFCSYLSSQSTRSLRAYITTFVFLLPVALLVYLQPDLGSALVYLGAVGLTMVIYGFPLLWFFISFLPLIATSPIVWTFLHEYQRQRILTFFNPTRDPLGTSYNVIQAMIAVGSGKFVGKGLSEGTQSGLRFLPENHTDFIFATLSERLGFMGSGMVLLAFALLFYRIFKIIQEADDDYAKLFGICTLNLFLIQFFVNIGMNIGILPVVGVTLPFVSLGGSSLLSNFIFLGILSSISMTYRRREVLQIH